MLKNTLIILFWVLYCSFSYAQKITGSVVSQSNQEPLGFAHVFLNNLSKGTNSDEHGYFEIKDLKAGRYELVVSYIGYETFVQTIEIEGDRNLKIELIPKATMLKEIVVEDDKHWKSNYEVFLRDFLGSTPNSMGCKIQNPDILDIIFKADSGLLKVSSNDMLLIENKALGYRIKYLLKEYRKDFRAGYMSYYGFMVFEEMKPKSKNQAKKWAKNRQETYLGSLQHFLRGVYQRNYEKNNFEVRKLLTIPTDRKPEDSIKTAIKSLLRKGYQFSDDTLAYWLKERSKPASQKYLIRQTLPPDSVSLFRQGKCFFNFTDQLQISYFSPKSKKKEPNISELTLISPLYAIEPNGILQNPLAVFTQGYWSWKEKIGDMLPYDFLEK